MELNDTLNFSTILDEEKSAFASYLETLKTVKPTGISPKDLKFLVKTKLRDLNKVTGAEMKRVALD